MAAGPAHLLTHTLALVFGHANGLPSAVKRCGRLAFQVPQIVACFAGPVRSPCPFCCGHSGARPANNYIFPKELCTTHLSRQKVYKVTEVVGKGV